MALNWLLEKHRLSAEQMLIVGDWKTTFWRQNAGWYSFVLTYSYNHGEPIANAEPDFVSDDIGTLIEVVLVSA